MKGMLGAIMDPDNILHLRAWLEVSGFSPSMDVIGGGNKKKKVSLNLTGWAFQSTSITAAESHYSKTFML